MFVAVIALAAFNVAPIAAAAFAGAVLLIVLRVISADEAYQGLRPEILMLIAGMVVLGIALEETGLAADATNALVGSLDSLQPLVALILLYGATLLLTELLVQRDGRGADHADGGRACRGAGGQPAARSWSR